VRTKLIHKTDEYEICPKCHELGKLNHHRHTYRSKKPNKVPVLHHYLEFRHPDKNAPNGRYRRCYLGAVKNAPKSLYDILERKDIDKAYRLETAALGLSKEIREYLNKYSANSSRKMEDIADDVLSIMEKYGF
jgi:hypothetical protein